MPFQHGRRTARLVATREEPSASPSTHPQAMLGAACADSQRGAAIPAPLAWPCPALPGAARQPKLAGYPARCLRSLLSLSVQITQQQPPFATCTQRHYTHTHDAPGRACGAQRGGLVPISSPAPIPHTHHTQFARLGTHIYHHHLVLFAKWRHRRHSHVVRPRRAAYRRALRHSAQHSMHRPGQAETFVINTPSLPGPSHPLSFQQPFVDSVSQHPGKKDGPAALPPPASSQTQQPCPCWAQGSTQDPPKRAESHHIT